MASAAYCLLGRWDEMEEQYRKAMKAAEEFSDNSLISYIAMVSTSNFLWMGDLQRALKYAELAVQKASAPADKASS